MKDETKSFYEQVVGRALVRVVQGLDEALDLAALARAAALSPLHFHRIFRGMVGETPLELHRRLRLERAAFQLATTDTSVTRIAFAAGYETHESFTRSFRDAYSLAPSAFRQRARAARAACERPRSLELAARSGIHFAGSFPVDLRLPIPTGESTMKVAIEIMPPLRLAAVAHVGPYNTISEAFARLGAAAGPAGLIGADALMVAIYHDAPDAKPAAELRSQAGIVVAEDVALPQPLEEVQIAGGRYARTTHVGPYALLGDTWSKLMGEWLPQSDQRLGDGLSFEIYRNDPRTTAPAELRTDIYVPVS